MTADERRPYYCEPRPGSHRAGRQDHTVPVSARRIAVAGTVYHPNGWRRRWWRLRRRPLVRWLGESVWYLALALAAAATASAVSTWILTR